MLKSTKKTKQTQKLKTEPTRSGILRLTIWIWSLTQCQEVHDGEVHLQDGGALPVHDGQAGSPPHRVVGQTPRQNHERVSAVGRKRRRSGFFRSLCNFAVVMRCWALEPAVNGWGGTRRFLRSPPEILWPHSERIHDGRRILLNYNDGYIKFCPLITDRKSGAIIRSVMIY